MKNFLLITSIVCLSAHNINAQVCCVQSNYSQDIKLSFVRDLSIKETMFNQVGVAPYVFNEYIPGTGEKFSMVGAYVTLYENRLKLDINNISYYMFNSAPWVLVSFNFKF